MMDKKTMVVIVAVVLCLVIVGVLPVVDNISSQYVELNENFEEFLKQPISSETSDLIEKWETEINNTSPFGKMFIKRRNEIETVKAENEKYIEETAQKMSLEISNYVPPKKLKSSSEYEEYKVLIDQMQIDEDTLFGKAVKNKVTNYYLVEEYSTQLDELVNSYAVRCSACSGRGTVVCEYCNGRGKNLVTWYDYGDWGDTSYTTYECKRCSGGRRNCLSCKDGYKIAWGIEQK